MNLFKTKNVIPYVSSKGDKVYPIVMDIKTGIVEGKAVFTTGDIDTAYLYATILEGQSEYNIVGTTVICNIQRPDGTTMKIHGDVQGNNLIEFPLGQSGVSQEGIYNFDIAVVFSEKKMVTSPTAQYSVTQSIEVNGEIEEDDRFPVLEGLISELTEIKEEELVRVSNENTRLVNESSREQAESVRVENEKTRQEFFENIKESINVPKIPTKLSELENDTNFLTTIPDEYVTDAELNGYATENYVKQEIQKIDVTSQLGDYAKKTELHSHSNKAVLDGITSSKVTEWNNKSTFSGSYNDLSNKPTIPTKVSQLTNDSKFITSIPSEYITETELNAKGYLTEHQDISHLATKEYVDNAITNFNIDIDYDSLLAFDTNEIITNSNYVDSDNNIILDDDLSSGIYTLKYEFEDGTYTDIKNFIIKNEPSGSVLNLLEEGTIYLNKTFDRNSISLQDFLGTVTIALPIDFDGKTQCTLKIQNSPRSLITYKDYNVLAFTDANMTTMSYVNGSTHFGYMNEGCWTVSDDGKSLGVCEFTPPADKQIMYLSLRIKHNGDDLTITEADFGDLNITLIVGDGTTEDETTVIDVMKEAELKLNQRWSKTSNDLVTQLGRVALIFPINAVDIDTVCTVTIENSPINLKTYRDYLTTYFLNESKSGTFDPQEGANPGYYNSFVWSSDNRSCTFSITVVPNCKYIVLNLPLKAGDVEATESDLNGLIITLKKEGVN